MKKPNKKIFKIILFILVLLFLAGICILIGKPMLKFMSEPEKFRLWVESKGLLGGLIFMLMNIVQVMLAIIPGGPFEIGAGYAFGIVKGSIICDIAMTLGSLFVFLLSRKFGLRFVELFFDKEKIESIKWLRSSKKGDTLVFLFFLFPGTPKDLFCYFLGMTDMKWWVFLLINFVGRFPAIILSASSGGALVKEKYMAFCILLAAMTILYLVGLLLYGYHQKKAKNSVINNKEQ